MRIVKLLIIVVVLGIVAAAVIPQFAGTSESAKAAKLSTLDCNVAELRGAVELYYHQHESVYPGQETYLQSIPSQTADEAAESFVAQLTGITDAQGFVWGVVPTDRGAATFFPPYFPNGLPRNPYNGLATVVCDITTTDVTVAESDGTTGWKFYVKTGTLIANDGEHDTR